MICDRRWQNRYLFKWKYQFLILRGQSKPAKATSSVLLYPTTAVWAETGPGDTSNGDCSWLSVGGHEGWREVGCSQYFSVLHQSTFQPVASSHSPLSTNSRALSGVNAGVWPPGQDWTTTPVENSSPCRPGGAVGGLCDRVGGSSGFQLSHL